MVPPVALLAIRLGFLALLWLFVVAIVLALRTDLYGPRSTRRAAVGGNRPDRKSRSRSSGRVGRGVPRLVITEGALTGTSLALTGAPVTIGRDDNSTLVITDDFASSHHARVFLQGEDWAVEDLGSTNGTYLDRTKVHGPVRLPPGTPVRIGKTVLELRR
jgi:hypothetical protein